MTTDKDTIESYDSHAPEWVERMRAKKSISHEYLEKPAMYAQLGSVQNLDILCVGCGSGEECDYLKKQGAGRVVGIDASKGLIEQAKYAYPEIEFYTQDVEAMNFPAGTFDVVYSSLVMHYLLDWTRALTSMRRALKDSGRILLSTHHPVKWGGESQKDGSTQILKLGFARDNQNPDKLEIYGDYLNTRLIKDVWFGNMPVNYYHKPLGEIFSEIAAAGLLVAALVEPKAVKAAEKIKPDFYYIHQKIPTFLILELQKK